MKLTTKQRNVLTGLKDRAPGRPTARVLADALETPRFRSAGYSYDEVYSLLRALEKKGAVQRVPGGKAVKWQLTEAGRVELA